MLRRLKFHPDAFALVWPELPVRFDVIYGFRALEKPRLPIVVSAV